MRAERFASLLRACGLAAESGEKFDNTEIKALSCDSRDVAPGTLFFVKGVTFKREYFDAAVAAGAVAYVSETVFDSPLPCLTVTDIRRAMPLCADLFYGHPSGKMPLVGVTGTKGKTTVTAMLGEIFNRAFDGKVGSLGTNGAAFGHESVPKSGGSTPEALEFYRLIDTFASRGAKAAVAEVSSQALRHERVTGTEFAVGLFTNLGRDHISATEHKDFDDYKDAKKKLFTMCRTGIFNADDAYCEEFMRDATCEHKVTVGIRHKADVSATNILLTARGASFTVSGGAYDGTEIELRIPGEFNVMNALCAIAAAEAFGCDVTSVREGLYATEVEGRMEIYEKNGITVLCDYAHNEVSFEAVFDHIRRFYPTSRVICLFGCQGNKALGRRRELPAVVGRYADLAILTSDDPENEEPKAIIDEVEIALRETGVPFVSVVDREEAVRYAVSVARPGDVLFLAGKGRETTQKVHGKTVYYKGDMPSAMEALGQ